MEGQASVPEDGDRIKAAIHKAGEGQEGSASDRLDDTVHGLVAMSALERAQEEGGERLDKYWKAMLQGEHREVRLKLRGALATQEKADELVDALSKNSAHSLQLLQIECEKAMVSLPERCPCRMQVECDSPMRA